MKIGGADVFSGYMTVFSKHLVAQSVHLIFQTSFTLSICLVRVCLHNAEIPYPMVDVTFSF